MNKPIAVIILNWNGAKLLREFLPSVCATTNADIADVIVADNGSTDDSLEILAREFPAVKVLALDKNYGFAEGYNRAIKATGYKYTVLLNSDVKTGSNRFMTTAKRIKKWRHANPKFFPIPSLISLNMQARPVDLSISWAIPSVVAAFSAQWRPITDNMIQHP